jgi:hypothetical protein
MMYPPCPPWVGWYSLWTLPPMHFHPGWSGPAGGFGHGGFHAGDSCYGSIGHQQDRKALRQENWMVWFPRRHLQLLINRTSGGCPRMELLLVDQGTPRVRQGRGAKLQPTMTKQSPMRREVQMRWQQNRIGSQMRRQRPREKPRPARSGLQTRQFSFVGFRIEEDIEDYRARGGTSTSLLSSMTHTQLEEEDLTDEGALQHHPPGDLDKARMEGE